MENEIIIKVPYIENIDDLVRYHVAIIENGIKHELFAEVEKAYGEYLSTERFDGLVYLVLPVALREGYNIVCEGKVTEQLLHNINEILIPMLAIGDEKIHKIKVIAPADDRKIGGGGGWNSHFMRRRFIVYSKEVCRNTVSITKANAFIYNICKCRIMGYHRWGFA